MPHKGADYKFPFNFEPVVQALVACFFTQIGVSSHAPRMLNLTYNLQEMQSIRVYLLSEEGSPIPKGWNIYSPDRPSSTPNPEAVKCNEDCLNFTTKYTKRIFHPYRVKIIGRYD